MKVEEIKKHVTHFSEELRVHAKHQEEVIVGGKITSIIPPLDDEYPMYIVMLDDLVGTTHVFVPEAMLQAYEKEFQVGNFVFLNGFVNMVSRHIKKETRKEISVFAYSMKDITKVGDTI